MSKILSGLLYLAVIIFSVLMVYLAEQTEKREKRNDEYKLTVSNHGDKRRHICFSIKQHSAKVRLFLIMAVLIPSILAGLRSDEVGTDVLIYGKLLMKEADSVSSFYELNRIDITYTEKGYRLFAFLISRIFDGTGWLLFFSQLLILTCVVYVLHSLKNDFSMWKGYAYFMFCIYYLSFNLMRQSISLVFIFVAFSFLSKSKYIKFLITSLIATMFHSFAIIVAIIMVIIWMLKEKIKNRTTKKLIIVLNIGIMMLWQYVMLFISKILIGPLYRYERYLVTENNLGVPPLDLITSPAFIINLIFCIISFNSICRGRLCKGTYDDVLCLFSIVGMFGSLLQIYLTVAYRVGIYFISFYTIYLPRMLEYKMPIDRKTRTIFFLFLIFAYWLFDCMLSGHSSTAIFTFR